MLKFANTALLCSVVALYFSACFAEDATPEWAAQNTTAAIQLINEIIDEMKTTLGSSTLSKADMFGAKEDLRNVILLLRAHTDLIASKFNGGLPPAVHKMLEEADMKYSSIKKMYVEKLEHINKMEPAAN